MALNIRDYGVIGDGIADDRAAFQSALDAGAGGEVFVPNGRYLLGRGAGFWCVSIPAGTALRGESRDGAVIVQARVDASVRLIEVDTANVTIESLTLDGNKAAQADHDEHRAGVFAHGATGLVIADVTSRDFTGDGVYIHIGTNSPRITGLLATGNLRNGITFGGGTTGGTITASQFVGNGAQQFDSEPGAGYSVDGLSISGCMFDPAGSAQYVLTIAGTTGAAHSKNWIVEDNTFLGTVEIIGTEDITFRRNVIRHAGNGSALLIYHANDRVLVDSNDIALTGPLGQEVIAVFGTGIGQTSDHVIIARNKISTGVANAFGVHGVCVRGLEVYDNTIAGNGIAAPYTAGVYMRSTVVGEDVRSLILRRNRISSFGAYGVSTAPSPGAVRLVDVSDNVFDAPGVAMKSLALAGDDLRQSGNVCLGNSTMLAWTPSGQWSPWGNGDRWLKVP